MPLPSLYINGQDIEALGMRIETCRGLRDIPAVSDPAITIPGRAGVMRTGAPSTVALRELVLTGNIFNSDGASRTHIDLLAKLDVLRPLFASGLLELRTVDRPTRAYTCRAPLFEVTTIGPEFVATAASFRITLQVTDPFAYDTQMSGIGFAAAATEVPLGTAPSGGILRIMGPATDPEIKYRDLTGVVRHTLKFSRTLLATDYEEIDLDLMTVHRVQSGVASNDIAALVSPSDLESFALSPEDGDALAGAYPTLECSGLTGDGNCELHYWRSWLGL